MKTVLVGGKKLQKLYKLFGKNGSPITWIRCRLEPHPSEKNDLMIGQMVLIKDDILPINIWLLGRILEVYYGSDEKVRVGEVKTKTGKFKRAITEIVVLPIET